MTLSKPASVPEEAIGPVTPPASIAGLRTLLGTFRGKDLEAEARVRAHEETLTKPPGALGRLEDLTAWLAAWQHPPRDSAEAAPPRAERALACIFAGNHGVAAHGVSAYPSEVTAQMVANFEAGGAAINQLCRSLDVELSINALNLDCPSQDFTRAAALSTEEFLAAVSTGMTAVPGDIDLLCLGEMGIGNTTAAAALCLALHGGEASDWTGPGTGLDGNRMDHKRRVVEQAVKFHDEEAKGDGLELLRRLGGWELAAIAGAILSARLQGIPVVLDGYVPWAAAACLETAHEGALDHCLAAHVSSEPGHGKILKILSKDPVMDLNLRLGEGSGAVLAVPLIRAAAACHRGMATFASAGVSQT